MDISRIEEASAASSQKALISQGMAAALEDGKLLGQLEAFAFITTVGETAMASIYEKVKKSKTWAFIPNPQIPTGGNFESLDDFCRVMLGKSYNRMQAIVSNRNAVTQELFDQSEKLGLRQADYNAIKALPLPDREAVQAAIADGSSREEVIAVLLDISGKVEKMTNVVDQLRGDIEAVEKVSADKSARLEKWERVEAKKSLTKETEEAFLNHKARPLYELVAAAGLLAQKLENAVLTATDEGDSLLKDEAYNSLTLITQYMLRAADRCNMPLDMEVLGLDATEFETKALGLGALDEKEEA